MAGYYNVTIKPTITASLQTVAFQADDVLFDWTKFYVPSNVGRLIGCNVNVRGTDGSRQEFALDVYFAKSDDFSLGTINSAVAIKPNNDMLGAMPVPVTAYMDGLNTMEVANVTTSARLTLQPVPEPIVSGTSPTGNYVLYMAGVAQGAFDFTTAALTDNTVDVSGLSVPTITTLDGTACNEVFGPGDIIHVQDDVVLGEVVSLDANNITFRADGVNQIHAGGVTLYETPDDFAAWQIQNGAGAAGDLANNDELHNIHPITLTLSFSYAK